MQQALDAPPEQTQALRAATLGASSVAGALGLSQHPKNTPLADWMARQAGYIRPDPTVAMQMGHATEGINRDRYAAGLPVGWRVIIPPQQAHPLNPWLTCHPDGFVIDETGRKRWGFEAKWTSRSEYRQDWPVDWVVQCQISMAICDLDRWDLSIMVGSVEPVVHTIGFDKDYAAKLLDLASWYWDTYMINCIGQPPAATVPDLALLARAPHARDELIPADDHTATIAQAHRRIVKQIAQLEGEAAALQLELVQSIGDAAGISGDFGKIYYKSHPRRATDWRRLATACDPPRDVVEQYTTRKYTARQFRAYYKEGAQDDKNGATGEAGRVSGEQTRGDL